MLYNHHGSCHFGRKVVNYNYRYLFILVYLKKGAFIMSVKKEQNMLVKEFSERLSQLPRLKGKGSQRTTLVGITNNFSLEEAIYGNWWYQYFSYTLYDKVIGKELVHLILHRDDSPPEFKVELDIRFLQYNEGNLVQDRSAKSYHTLSENLILDKVVSHIPIHLVSTLLTGFKELDKKNGVVSKNG